MNNDMKVIGFYAENEKNEALCLDENECLIAGSQIKMEEYMKEMEIDEKKKKKMQIKKIRFGEIIDEMKEGISFSLDEESYKRYYPLAKIEELEPLDWEKESENGKYKFITLTMDIIDEMNDDDDDDDEDEITEVFTSRNMRGYGIFEGIEKEFNFGSVLEVKNDSELTLEIKCKKCRNKYEYKVGKITFNAEKYKGEFENDPVCPKCKAEKSWELKGESMRIASELLDIETDKLQEE